MARSPIRGVDPYKEEVGDGPPADAKAAAQPAVEAAQTDSPTAAAEAEKTADEEPVPVNAAEKPAEPEPESPPVEPAPAKTPLKKPLGLSLRKAPSEVKPPPGNKMQIDGAIELTLSAANTAVDAAQEIQRLRAELEMVSSASKRSRRLLFAAIFLIAACAAAGLTGALMFYQKSLLEFQTLAKINRDVLLTFAGEVKGLSTTSKSIEETVQVSAQALAAASAQTEEIRKAIQSFTAAQKALEAKIAPASAYDKQFSGLQQPIDDLTALNNTINSRLIEIEKARQARDQARRAVVEPPKAEPPKAPAKPEASREQSRENMVRYP